MRIYIQLGQNVLSFNKMDLEAKDLVTHLRGAMRCSRWRALARVFIVMLCYVSVFRSASAALAQGRTAPAEWRLTVQTDKTAYHIGEPIKLIVRLKNTLTVSQDAMNGGIFFEYRIEIMRNGTPLSFNYNVLRRMAEGSSWLRNIEPGKSLENVSQIEHLAKLTSSRHYTVNVSRDVKVGKMDGWFNSPVRKVHLIATATFEIVRPKRGR